MARRRIGFMHSVINFTFFLVNFFISLVLPDSGKGQRLHNLPMSARAWVAVVMDTTKLGTDEQDRLTLRPSANRTILLPLGQMMWSTCGYIRVRLGWPFHQKHFKKG
jgi:hypothetical protein